MNDEIATRENQKRETGGENKEKILISAPSLASVHECVLSNMFIQLKQYHRLTDPMFIWKSFCPQSRQIENVWCLAVSACVKGLF